MKLVLASANRHKAQEFARLLPGFDVEPYAGQLPEETGSTFRENAELKAREVHRATGGRHWVLADDSGIEAAALGGRPGVRSARLAGEEATDEQNLEALLSLLEGHDDRRVRYVAELVAIAPEGWELHARGELPGTLAPQPRGSGGFGYDPAFVPDGEARTVAEMSPQEKDAISHRARAGASLRDQLRSASAETDRLLLRAIQPGDRSAFEPIWADPEAMRYIGMGVPRVGQEALDMMDRLVAHREEHGFGLWTVIPKGQDRVVGWAGLSVPRFLPAVLPAVECGWLLAPSAWGNGYATEAGLAALRHGFGDLRLDRIISIIYPGNERSAAVARRLGMRQAGDEVHSVTGRTVSIWETLGRPGG
ncbi:MAG: XTP/dITP diphosphohydrolase [Gaiellales bacterium]|jgi:XTP/dITP diphosphohydrolase|nr:XTP/dITP diphosphohydrolase [Gaiellales bacterium]